MQRWRLDVAWRGDHYVGWQRQPNGPSIQAALEAAASRITGGEPVVMEASGRTDAGVHALHQVVAFSSGAQRTPERLRAGLNGVLPKDIVVLEASAVSADFSPRRWTRRKTYRYRILNRRPRCPFRQGAAWHVRQPLDASSMAEAALRLPGTWDWASFRAAGCGAKTTVRTLESLTVRPQDDELWVEAVGHGFLRHQVRILTGTLVEVGRGRVGVREVTTIRDARLRDAAGPTAPAHGLWLVSVEVGAGPHIAGQEVR